MKQKEIASLFNAPPDTRLYGIVGPMGIGKDYTATEVLGVPVLKFASPLYVLAEACWPGFQKQSHGGRQLLQTLGAWGRGEVSEHYPITVERCLFLDALDGIISCSQSSIAEDVDWHAFGNPGFWIGSALDTYNRMLVRSVSDTVFAFTDVRYENEAAAVRKAGGVVVALVCSEGTLARRRGGIGYVNADDSTEKYANQLYTNFFDPDASMPPGVTYAWNGPHPSAPVNHPKPFVLLP